MKIIKRAFYLLVLLLGLSITVPTTEVRALDSSSFNPGNIISDNVFTNKDAMTVNQIQAFLESKNSACLKNFKSLALYDDDGNGLGDEPYGRGDDNNKVLASKLIHQAAQIYNINPQVILVTLEKEQGLVTRSDCPSWRYNTALGYGCPDTEPCDQSAYGFTRQIDYGVWHFRGFFDDSLNIVPYTPGTRKVYFHPGPCRVPASGGGCDEYYGRFKNNPDIEYCGSTNVNIQNRATASLYSYTPYQPNQASLDAFPGTGNTCSSYGNRNFWFFFNNWFSSTPFFRIGNTAPVYILGSNNNYYRVPSMDVLKAYGYGKTIDRVMTVNDGYIDGLSNTGTLSRIARFEGSSAVYLMDDGKIHHFSSRSLVEETFGYTLPDDVAILPDNIKFYFPQGPSMKTVLQERGRQHIYSMEDGKRRHIVSRAAFDSGDPAYSLRSRMQLSSSYLSTLSRGSNIFAPGTLYRIGPTAAVYLINDFDSSLKIPSRAIFDHFGFSPSDVLQVSESHVSGYPVSGDLDHLVRAGNIWLVYGGRFRIHIPFEPMAAEPKYNLDISNIPLLRPDLIRVYSGQASVKPDLIKADNDTRVYLIEEGKKRWITSRTALEDKGYSLNQVIQVSQQFVNSLPSGSKIE